MNGYHIDLQRNIRAFFGHRGRAKRDLSSPPPVRSVNGCGLKVQIPQPRTLFAHQDASKAAVEPYELNTARSQLLRARNVSMGLRQ